MRLNQCRWAQNHSLKVMLIVVILALSCLSLSSGRSSSSPQISLNVWRERWPQLRANLTKRRRIALRLDACQRDGRAKLSASCEEVVKLGKMNWDYRCSCQNRFIAATLVSSRSINRLSWHYMHVIENLSLCHWKIGKSTTVVDLHCSFTDVGRLLTTRLLVVWSSLL